MTRRIERATALLRRGDLSVTEVCFAVGCASLGTFTTRFTELVGMPSGAFRRQAAHAAADHAHPEVNDPADVQRAVAQTYATRPGLRFYIDTILGNNDSLFVVGGVGHESRPDTIDSRLIWLIRLLDGQMAEMWTYRLSTP
ncbi:hypothetical protein M878_45245 [Streptomyces roseochromogenus subsp. oscitans DS 12.976]|uniref:HTH araC/xylS-type domain-containing protein n=1 Tax=Streptomyces roseochromogenus subsp. oscitans DS 12.976 TaxID=1352936 RepID=V6JNW7_STRRC|nr:hypothetical protein M878_45245 [Streptomyces roseochromogenus subsp. oscitans DS 12.976]